MLLTDQRRSQASLQFSMHSTASRAESQTAAMAETVHSSARVLTETVQTETAMAEMVKETEDVTIPSHVLRHTAS